MLKRCHIYHAPWSRWFKTFYCHGSYAHEVQLGPLVFQWFFDKFENRKLKVWRDQYWNI